MAPLTDNILADSDGIAILDDSGDWIITDGPATLPTQVIAVSVGGADLFFDRIWRLAALPGSYLLNGSNAAVTLSRVATLASFGLSVTGADAGMSKTTSSGDDFSPGEVAILGQVAALSIAKYLSLESGSIAISGKVSLCASERSLLTTPTVVALLGISSGLSAVRGVTAETGTVSTSGASVEFDRQTPERVLYANAGDVSFSGNAATTSAIRSLQPSPDSLVISGLQSVGSIGKTLVSSPGSDVVAGSVANGLKDSRLRADSGALSLSGSSSATIVNHVVAAAYSAVNISGREATFTKSVAYHLPADAGNHDTTGREAFSILVRALLATPGDVYLSGSNAEIERGYQSYVPAKHFTRIITPQSFIRGKTTTEFYDAIP